MAICVGWNLMYFAIHGIIDKLTNFVSSRQNTSWESFCLVVRPGITHPRMHNARWGIVLPALPWLRPCNIEKFTIQQFDNIFTFTDYITYLSMINDQAVRTKWASCPLYLPNALTGLELNTKQICTYVYLSCNRNFIANFESELIASLFNHFPTPNLT